MDIISYTLGKKAGGGQPQPANLQEKEVSITQNGESTVRPDTGYDGLSKVDITANVQPDLESKSVTIEENGTTTVTPTSGKDGLSSVTITTDIDKGIDWSDVGYTTADPIYVDLLHSKAKEVLADWDKDNPHLFTNDNTLLSAPTLDLTWYDDNATNPTGMFSNCANLECVSNTFNARTYREWFKGCAKLAAIDISNFSTEKFILGSVGAFREMFYNCTNLIHVEFGNFETFDVTKTNNLSNMFYKTKHFDEDTLDQILRMCILMTPNISSNNRKLSVLGIDNTFDNYSSISNLSNYNDFIAEGWAIE